MIPPRPNRSPPAASPSRSTGSPPDDAIAHATLTVNRRQTHPDDQTAFAALRAGDLDTTRTIRTAHGWDHQTDTAQETRQALAQAAVTDTDRHGVDQVAVLAVSHADCEDLTDRIRTIRAGRGELRGPTLTGPGWGPDLRTYAAGDRILLHATIDPGPHPRLFNGATGTITSITAHGAQIAFDHGEHRTLTAALIAGRRADGTPNVSHSWARTVDGAQGGTWTQTHLLGTPTLDRFTGYVGHSRGRQPTHTWNTRPDATHPLRLLADDRTPTDTVADAMARAEPKTLAATDDPHTLDRRLRTERDHHTAVLATRPPDPTWPLDQARKDAARAGPRPPRRSSPDSAGRNANETRSAPSTGSAPADATGSTRPTRRSAAPTTNSKRPPAATNAPTPRSPTSRAPSSSGPPGTPTTSWRRARDRRDRRCAGPPLG